ncbi:hypothetical protein M501DRAFT_1000130 [Patellaria atrata CBS 101060]|uniref:Six-hairpin glycosidase-like protein n=1 Tax=Patellaria atrata CBS 101060 TaxID=1346257 RepID=A0A9P4S1P3_9PEZI|nr:hypothetical protein M501DRAFT_1000130 [Patellaria atrata CBS 101060]
MLISLTSLLLLWHAILPTICTSTTIDRRRVVTRFNPYRNASSDDTPMQVGNGNLGFGADITGLQTFRPFNTLSSWGWHNVSLPTTPGQTSIDDFTGLQWWTHGRLVTYNQPNPAQRDISQWLIGNPHRINLARVGFDFSSNVTEKDLTKTKQYLDLYSGVIHSSFKLGAHEVTVQTIADPNRDAIAVQVKTSLLSLGQLSIFIDFPYGQDGKTKFEAPFVGVWNATEKHTTTLKKTYQEAHIRHNLDTTTYFTSIRWQGQAKLDRLGSSRHRFMLRSPFSDTLTFTVNFSPSEPAHLPDFRNVKSASSDHWEEYWSTGAFVDLTSSANQSATELQRRIILSQYLLAVNGASRDPPQESGLVNNGWYGKFHLEMVIWHSTHWILWGKRQILNLHVPGVYERFLAASFPRARNQGYTGARWGKMSDPTGRSAPGEINSLLIWQQPHPIFFAELEYSRSQNKHRTLKKWDAIIKGTADFMTSYAFFNQTTSFYDLGPPMYPASENTPPNATRNPMYELAYWRFGLDVASKWQRRQGKPVPATWTEVASNLAPLPIQDGMYVTYEGIGDMWNTSAYTEDHPTMLMPIALLPSGLNINNTIMRATLDKIFETWNFTFSYGWDFPLFSMAAAKFGDAERAVGFLLHDEYKFDDVGMPVGGTRVPTPYFPASGGLLLAVAMMAADRTSWPSEWIVKTEGFGQGGLWP